MIKNPPKKNHKDHSAIPKILFAAALCVILISGYKIGSTFWGYREGQNTYREVKKAAAVPERIEEEPEQFQPDLKKLKEINPDCVGYLYAEDVLSYPIVQGSDNSYYLTHLFDGTENRAGSLFMDAASSGFDSKNCVIYGHNMKDGSMFGTLLYYSRERYYKKHPVFYLYTEQGCIRYHVLSAFRTPAGGFAYQSAFSSENEYQRFLEKLSDSASYLTAAPKPLFQTNVITLSTCTDDADESFRYVVVLVPEKAL